MVKKIADIILGIILFCVVSVHEMAMLIIGYFDEGFRYWGIYGRKN